MRRRMLLTAAWLTVLGCCTSLAVAGGNYSFYYRGSEQTTDQGGRKLYFWGDRYYRDGFDGEVPMGYGGPALEDAVNVGIYKINGLDGWDGATGFYMKDMRAPLPPGHKATFDIYLWAGANVPKQNLYIYQPSFYYLSPGLTYKLVLVSIPAGVTYSGSREWGPDHGIITLPFYSTDDPFTGYQFLAEITAIPEPSCILALGLAVSGLGTSMVRRRRV